MSDWKGPAFRRTLVAMVRRHVPERDVEDIVQATLTCALTPAAPKDEEALQRWLIGVARHKVADRHRRGRRESFELPEVAVDAAPHSEADLVRWAEQALPEGGDDPRRTLGWMMREGDGEKLEAIAESEQVPAARVRKRVSRLRSHLRAQWKKELALLAALGVVAVLVWIARHAPKEDVAHEVRPVPSEVAPSPVERARSIRDEALAACDRAEWVLCLDGLDRARAIDPAGDAEERVQKGRAAAESALRGPPVPAPSTPPTPAPSSIVPVPPPRSTSAPAPDSTSAPSAPRPPRPSKASRSSI
jgi:DNA-directed RNA polymerase specialized sigma24 family protein